MDDVIKNFYLNGGAMRGISERQEQEKRWGNVKECSRRLYDR